MPTRDCIRWFKCKLKPPKNQDEGGGWLGVEINTGVLLINVNGCNGGSSNKENKN